MTNPYTDVRMLTANFCLSDLTAFLRAREAAEGMRILSISATHAAWQEHALVHPATLVTVINEAPPTSPVEVIEFQTPNPPPVPPGKTLVCIGHCFIGGDDSNVLVYR